MQNFRRAKSGALACVLIRAHWGPGWAKFAAGAVQELRLGLLSQLAGIETCRARRLGAPLRSAVGAGALTRPPFWETRPGGRPKGLPYERYGTVSVENVGEGLKVNRPKAERSHPGVCPSRRIPGSSPYLAGRSGTGPYETPPVKRRRGGPMWPPVPCGGCDACRARPPGRAGPRHGRAGRCPAPTAKLGRCLGFVPGRPGAPGRRRSSRPI